MRPISDGGLTRLTHFCTLCTFCTPSQIHSKFPFQSKSSEQFWHSQEASYAWDQSYSIIVRKLEQDRVMCSTWRGKFLSITWCFSLVYFLCSCLVVFIRSPFPAFSIKSWQIRFITKWCSWKLFKEFAASWKYSKTPYKEWCQCNKHVFTHSTNIYLPTFFWAKGARFLSYKCQDFW